MSRAKWLEVVEEGIPHLINIEAIDFIEGLPDGECLIHLNDGNTSFQVGIDFPDIVGMLDSDD